jgi:hypothetical protein
MPQGRLLAVPILILTDYRLVQEDEVRIPSKLLFAFLLIVPGYQGNEPRATQAASEPQAGPTDQMKKERDQYIKSMDARLAEFDKKTDGLGQRIRSMSSASRAPFRNMIDQLRRGRKDVATKLADLKGVNADSWATKKRPVDVAMASLDRAYQQASAKIPAAAPAR